MPQCKTDIERLRLMQLSLTLFVDNSCSAIDGFANRYNELMASFEAKHQALKREEELAKHKLEVCESHVGPNGEPPLCAVEEARYTKVSSQLDRVEQLINNAQSYINQYEQESVNVKMLMNRKKPQAVRFLADQISLLVNEYVSDGVKLEGMGGDIEGEVNTQKADSSSETNNSHQSDSKSDGVASELSSPTPGFPPDTDYSKSIEEAAISIVSIGGDTDIESLMIQTKAKQLFYDRYGMDTLHSVMQSDGTQDSATEKYNQILHELEESIMAQKSNV